MKEYNTRNIRKMLIIRVFLLPFAVLILVCGTIIYFFVSYSGRQVKNELMRIATDHRNLINQFLSEKSAILQFTAASFSSDDLMVKSNLERIFKNLQAQSKVFFDLGLFDENGNHVAYAGPFNLAGKSYAKADWFKAVQSREVFISDEFLGFRKIPHFIIAVRKEEDQKAWYLRATIDTYYFNDLVENIRIGRTGEAYIINKAGLLQTKKRSGGQIMESDADFDLYSIKAGSATAFFTKGGLIEGYLYASAPIGRAEWILIVRQSIDDAYAPLISSILISFLILSGGGTS